MFMTSFRWDENFLLRRHQELLSELIASYDAMITVDSSECPKKGKESVGVAHQYCGNLGKVANCQSGVFIGYTSSKGYGLLGRQLYMPEIWFTDEYIERREKCQVPEDLYEVPIGKASVMREGRDITIVAISYASHLAQKAAEELCQSGIEVEIVDLRTAKPIDQEPRVKN